MKYITVAASLIASALLIPSYAVAEPAEENSYSGHLTGDWGGARHSMEEAGISAELLYKFDVIGNTSGGIKEGTRALDNLDAIFTFDGEKLVGARGLGATVHLVNNFGGRPDVDLVGSSQGIDNIEVIRPAFIVYQAYLEQNLLDDRLSILAGIYGADTEFYITDSSMLFLHSTFGTGTDFAQSGQNGPSIFPYTSVGSRIRVKPTDYTYIQAAVLDGVPGDVDHPRGTHINFGEDDGVLVIAETGYTPEGAKVAVGGWYYTEELDHLTLPGVKEHSQGAYIIGEKQVYQESGEQGLAIFGHLGFANSEVEQFDYAWSTGLLYTGLFRGRDEGQMGFGITGAHNGSEFRDAAVAAGTPVNTAETTFELTYNDFLTPWLCVQPDVQYIINPGTDPSRDNALVLGTRFSMNF